MRSFLNREFNVPENRDRSRIEDAGQPNILVTLAANVCVYYSILCTFTSWKRNPENISKMQWDFYKYGWHFVTVFTNLLNHICKLVHTWNQNLGRKKIIMKLSKKYYLSQETCINSLCFFIHWENWNKSCNVFFFWSAPFVSSRIQHALVGHIRYCPEMLNISIYNKNYLSEEIWWLNEIWVSRQGRVRWLDGSGVPTYPTLVRRPYFIQ